MSDDTNTKAAEAVYPDGSTPPLDPATGLPILEDRSADFPDEAAEAVEVVAEPVTSTGRRLGATSGISAFRGLMAKRRERAKPTPEPVTAPVVPDTEEERAAALAAAAEKGYTEADLIDSDGNPLDVAGIYRSLTVEGEEDGAEGSEDAGGSDDSGDDGSTPDAAAEAAPEGAEGDDAGSDDATGDDGAADDAGDEGSEEEDGNEEPPAEPEPETPSDEGFDPEAHTVTEVQAYLAEHPDQATYVLDRERTGKARVTLIGA
ncbi:hypothetical protein SEA_NICOLE72_24 [Microbacterium phage Nicole72]|uniref:Uncharacterized protein n=1 Tax=Microbacterium phage Nicole72 TaxID=3062838 RepID=A0ACD4UJE8_9CAUD|nr:hypothetical protein SEA_NICOLE72_24 [Microbacterium phage Nicole72]